MHKPIVLTTTILFLLSTISACTAAAPSPTTAPTPTTSPEPSPTPLPYSETNYTTALEITFDEWRSLQNFFLLGTFDEEGNENQATYEDARLENGAWLLGGTIVGGANLKSVIEFETGVHVRWKVIGEDTCHAFELMPLVAQHEPLQSSSAAGVGGCGYQHVQLETQGPNSHPSSSEGRVVMLPGTWIEAILWVERDPGPVLKLFAWESDNPQISTMAKLEIESWREANAFMLAIEHYEDGLQDSEFAVDSMKLITGDLYSYLWYHAPAFQPQHESSMEFLETDSSPDAASASPEEDLAQDLPVRDELPGNLLTWPALDPILPYFFSPEDLEDCRGCADLVAYGVQLDPAGFIFWSNFGPLPGDPSPEASSSDSITQQIQLTMHDWEYQDLIAWLHRNQFRLQPHQVGDPLPFPDRIHMRSHALLNQGSTLVHIIQGGPAPSFEEAQSLVKDTIQALPEENLQTPDLVPPPEMNLQEDSRLAYAHLADKSQPAVPVEQMNLRNAQVNLWLQVQEPVEQLEAAMFHPGSNTYLAYIRIPDPPAGKDLMLFENSLRSGNYYLQHLGGPLEFHVWIDGSLVRMLPLEVLQ